MRKRLFTMMFLLTISGACSDAQVAPDSSGLDHGGLVDAEPEPAGPEVTLRLDWANATDSLGQVVVIPDTFVGLSIEYDTGPYDLLGSVHGPNTKFLKLLENIRGKGTLRMGGMSQEMCGGFNSHATGSWCQYNSAGVNAAGWQARHSGWYASMGANISGLNSGISNHHGFMGAIGRNFPGGKLLRAIDVGNEPEYVDNGISGDEYIHRYNAIKAATSAFYREYLAGTSGAWSGNFSRGAWLARFKAAVNPRYTTHHAYGANGQNASDCTVSNLMAPAKMNAIIKNGVSAGEPDISVTSAVKNGRLHKINEANSCFLRGRAGVSDRQVAAVFGMDLMARSALAGARGVFFHTAYKKACAAYAPSCVSTCPELGGIRGTCAAYNAIAGGWNGSGYVVNTRPLYYAILVFSTFQGCTMNKLPEWGDSSSNLTAYTFTCPDGWRRVALLNKDPSFDGHVKVYVESTAPYKNGGTAVGERVWSLKSSDSDSEGFFEGDIPQLGKYGAGVRANSNGTITGEQSETYAKHTDETGDYFLVPLRPGHIVSLAF
jgi:hypothetical protein